MIMVTLLAFGDAAHGSPAADDSGDTAHDSGPLMSLVTILVTPVRVTPLMMVRLFMMSMKLIMMPPLLMILVTLLMSSS